MAKKKLNTTTTALVIAVGIIALSFVTGQTGFVAVAPEIQIDFCTDSDTGFDTLHTVGACQDANGIHKDICASELSVQETSCLAGSKICAYDVVTCPVGETCSSGRCV